MNLNCILRTLASFMFAGVVYAEINGAKAKGDLIFRDSNGRIYGREGDGPLYFWTAKEYPGHVGIYSGSGTVIHAYGWMGQGTWIREDPTNATKGVFSFFDTDKDGRREHTSLGSKTHMSLQTSRNAALLRDNIVKIAKAQLYEEYDGDMSQQKGPNSSDWSCSGFVEKVYESCSTTTTLKYGVSYGDEADYNGGLNITPDGYRARMPNSWYCESDVEFSQVGVLGLLGRPFVNLLNPPSYVSKYIFFPFTQFVQPTLVDSFDPDAASGTIAPSITLTEPKTVVTADRGISIRWCDSDPDSEATISLYEDNNNSGYNGTLLVSGLAEEPDNFGYHWLNTSGMPDGKEFYIYAKIDDNHSVVNSGNYTAKIVIDHPAEGSDLSVAQTVWTDRYSPNGDLDGVPEGWETNIQVTVRLRNNSGSDVTSVEAYLCTTGDAVRITDDYGDWGTILHESVSSGDGLYKMDINLQRYSDCPFTLYATYKKDDSPYYQEASFTKTFPAEGEVNPVFEVDHVVFDDSDLRDGDGDGILESGENSEITLYLKNTGNADAARVYAVITDIPEFDVPQTELKYPDMMQAGGAAAAENGKTFRVQNIPSSFAGTVGADIVVTYGEGELQNVISAFPLFDVKPAAWLEVSPKTWDFGIAAPGSPICKTLTIRNCGSTNLQVISLDVSAEDISCTSNGLPWDIAPGQSTNIAVAINTAGLDGKITRQIIISVNTETRIRRTGLDDALVITGLVSDQPPAYAIRALTEGTQPDASGNTIVWADMTGVDVDIQSYNLLSGEYCAVATNVWETWNPRIDGNLVAWDDLRTFPGSGSANRFYDVYCRILTNDQEIVVANSSAPERLVGVCNGQVSFVKLDDELTESVSGSPTPTGVWNLYVYDVATGITMPITSYSRSGQNPFRAVDGYAVADFGGGQLAWREMDYTWQGSYWNGSGAGAKTFRPGKDVSPNSLDIVPGEILSCTEALVAFRRNEGDFCRRRSDNGVKLPV